MITELSQMFSIGITFGLGVGLFSGFVAWAISTAVRAIKSTMMGR